MNTFFETNIKQNLVLCQNPHHRRALSLLKIWLNEDGINLSERARDSIEDILNPRYAHSYNMVVSSVLNALRELYSTYNTIFENIYQNPAKNLLRCRRAQYLIMVARLVCAMLSFPSVRIVWSSFEHSGRVFETSADFVEYLSSAIQRMEDQIHEIEENNTEPDFGFSVTVDSLIAAFYVGQAYCHRDDILVRESWFYPDSGYDPYKAPELYGVDLEE